MLNITDKEVVVMALVIIGIYSLYQMGVDAENVITSIVSGLCGIAVGKSLEGKP